MKLSLTWNCCVLLEVPFLGSTAAEIWLWSLLCYSCGFERSQRAGTEHIKQKCRHNFKGATAEYWDVCRMVVVRMKLQFNWEPCWLFSMIWQLPVAKELGQGPLPLEGEEYPQVAGLCSACGREQIPWTLSAACKRLTYLKVDGSSPPFLKVKVFFWLNLWEETWETAFWLKNPPPFYSSSFCFRDVFLYLFFLVLDRQSVAARC